MRPINLRPTRNATNRSGNFNMTIVRFVVMTTRFFPKDNETARDLTRGNEIYGRTPTRRSAQRSQGYHFRYPRIVRNNRVTIMTSQGDTNERMNDGNFPINLTTMRLFRRPKVSNRLTRKMFIMGIRSLPRLLHPNGTRPNLSQRQPTYLQGSDIRGNVRLLQIPRRSKALTLNYRNTKKAPRIRISLNVTRPTRFPSRPNHGFTILYRRL